MKESAINKAVGRELRRVREDRGWTRATVVDRMSNTKSVQSYANYEYGIRPCTLPVLVDICQALGVVTSMLIAITLQRTGMEPESDVIYLDMNAILRENDRKYLLLRRWARNRHRKAIDDSGVTQMNRDVAEEMATFFGHSVPEFLAYLYRFTPQCVPYRIIEDST